MLVIRNIGKLYTLEGLSTVGGTAARDMRPHENAIVVVEGGFVTFAGSPSHLPTELQPLEDVLACDAERSATSKYNPYPLPPEVTRPAPDLTLIDAHEALVTPGLVDPHTHVLYGGNRASELSMKLAGVPYLDILARGGGILSTVRATRAATDEELYESTSIRLEAMLHMGTTTVEVKTGYGLSLEEELRHLRIIRDLASDSPLRLVPTFMGAHAAPTDFRDDSDRYVREVIEHMIPEVARQGIARFCDVFCEPGVFSTRDSIRILEAAASSGLERKIHADEIAPTDQGGSGAAVAAQVGATSAEHLRATGPEGMRRLAEARVVPVLLPATTFCLRESQYADARTMIDDFDLPVALATDCNPGTSPTESLQLVMALAALYLRMTPEEILAGVTINAARAVRLHEDVGSLERGKAGDAVIWQAFDLDLLPYRFGANQASTVIVGGELPPRRKSRGVYLEAT